jgi:hypothetical protein
LEITYIHHKYRVHTIPLLLNNKRTLKKDLLKYVDLFRPGHKLNTDNPLFSKNPGAFGPGIQCGLSYSDADSITSLNKIFSTAVLNYHNTISNRTAIDTYTNSWVFISDPSNRDSNYHNHIQFASGEVMSSSYTWTYYLEVPNNCTGDEGKLFFSKDKSDENSISLFPEEDTLYIFPATLEHRPDLNPNSTNRRIVLAGNTFLSYQNKTLI